MDRIADGLIHAFPEPMWAEAEAPVRLLSCRVEAPRIPRDEQAPRFLHVAVGAFPVAIPYRLYDDEGLPHLRGERLFEAFAERVHDRGLSDRQIAMLFCLLSRHHDGFVREAALSQIAGVREMFVAPFVTQLAAEYVYEILVKIRLRLAEFDSRLFGAFFQANPDFLALSRQRMVSYWNCYYRGREQYIGFDIFDAFTAMAQAD